MGILSSHLWAELHAGTSFSEIARMMKNANEIRMISKRKEINVCPCHTWPKPGLFKERKELLISRAEKFAINEAIRLLYVKTLLRAR